MTADKRSNFSFTRLTGLVCVALLLATQVQDVSAAPVDVARRAHKEPTWEPYTVLTVSYTHLTLPTTPYV